MYGPIASGGMATVHFGRLLSDGGFGRMVAIKRLREQFAASNDVLASLVDEARLVSRIQHPNVVPCLDIVTADGEVFVIMEYVAGESLSRVSAAIGAPVPADIVGALVGGVLFGLQAAHDATSELGEPLGIVHRDVSPQNILVGRDGHARLLDFGVAKARNRLSAATDSGIIKGKLAYMSPEQVANAPVDHRTDLFAVGVVLWELLAGMRLFQASNEAATIMKVASAPIPDVSIINPAISKDLAEVTRRALTREPSERFQSAQEFALALERAQSFASAAKVSVWLDAVVSPSLRARADAVAEIERAGADPSITSHELGTDTGATAGNLTSPARRAERSGPRWAFTLFAVILAGLAGWLLWMAASQWRDGPSLARGVGSPMDVVPRSREASGSSEPLVVVMEPTPEVATEPAPSATDAATASARAWPTPPRAVPSSPSAATTAATCERLLGADGIWRLSPPGCSL